MPSDAEVIAESLSHLVNKDYPKAEEVLSSALKDNPSAELYDKLAAIKLEVGQDTLALKHSEDAVKLSTDKPEYFVRKGMAEFKLQQYSAASKSYESALNLVKEGKNLSAALEKIAKTQLRNCKAELEADSDSDSDDSDADSEDDANAQNTSRAKALQGVLTGAPVMQSESKAIYKHEYYQTGDTVILTIKAKHCDPESVRVQYSQDTVSVHVFDETDSQAIYSRVFKLFGRIDEDHSSHKVMSTKIELKLSKARAEHWTELEKPFNAGEKQKLKSAYSSKKDWNAIERSLTKAEEYEKPEGDAAMNKLFSDIYSKASDDTRRAMNKSFSQSGGTVLSTNWDEVDKADYLKDRTVPDGMEWRSWEGDKIPVKEKDYSKKD